MVRCPTGVNDVEAKVSYENGGVDIFLRFGIDMRGIFLGSRLVFVYISKSHCKGGAIICGACTTMLHARMAKQVVAP